MQISYNGERASKNLNPGSPGAPTRRNYFLRYPNEYYNYDDIVSDLQNAHTWSDKDDILYNQTEYVKGMPVMDNVYTYKNISRARTQGIEAEVTHQVARDFTIKAGYTYLDAYNRQTGNRLEGRGRHMFNLTMTYSDPKNGWRATFWGDYTRNYLDIRDRIETGRIIAENGATLGRYYTFPGEGADAGKTYYVFENQRDAETFMHGDIEHGFTREKVAREKNYGLWNLMIEKDYHHFLTFYAGITNLFNQYDPFLGMGGRIYRFGMRMTF